MDVIEDALAVVSLNTLYFYDSNKGQSSPLVTFGQSVTDFYLAVGGCIMKEPEDPGNLQLDWLEVQLKLFRSRGMQVCSHLNRLLPLIFPGVVDRCDREYICAGS